MAVGVAKAIVDEGLKIGDDMEITAKDIDVLETKFNQIWRSL